LFINWQFIFWNSITFQTSLAQIETTSFLLSLSEFAFLQICIENSAKRYSGKLEIASKKIVLNISRKWFYQILNDLQHALKFFLLLC